MKYKQKKFGKIFGFKNAVLRDEPHDFMKNWGNLKNTERHDITDNSD